jgi:hypothetical protein
MGWEHRDPAPRAGARLPLVLWNTPKVAEAPLLDACPTVRIASAFHPEILAGMPCPYVMMSSRGSDRGRLSNCAVIFCLGGNGKSSAHRARRRPNLPLRAVKTGRSMSSGFSPSRRGLPARQLERDGPISGYGTLRGGEARRGDCIRHAAVSLEELRLRKEGLGTTGNHEERAIAAPRPSLSTSAS